jgi:hypothetical protein
MLGIATAVPEGKLFKENYGVEFIQQEDIAQPYGQWEHILLYPLKTWLENFEIQPLCEEKGIKENFWAESCNDTLNLLMFNRLENNLLNQIKNLRKIIKELLPIPISTNLDSPRVKRGWINLFGNILHTVGGVARDSDIHKLRRQINEIEKLIFENRHIFKVHSKQFKSVQMKVTQDLQNFHELFNLTDKRIDRLTSSLKLLDSEFSEAFEELLTEMSKLRTSVRFIIEMVTHRLYSLIQYKSHLQEFLSALRLLINDKLSPFLVTPDMIQKITENIHEQIKEKYPSFQLSLDTIANKYKQASVTSIVTRQTLIVRVRFNLFNKNSHFRLYTVKSWPVPLTGDNDHYTQILELPKLLAIDINGEMYMHPTETELQNCKKWTEGNLVCPVQSVIRPFTTASCALALFLNDPEKVTQLCNIHRIEQDPKHPTRYLRLKPNHFFMFGFNTGKWTLLCPNKQPKEIPSCRYCKIVLEDACSLHGQDFFIPGEISEIQNEKVITTHHMSYPLNFLALKEFYDQPSSDFWKKSQIRNSSLKTNLPIGSKIFQHKWSNLMHKNDKITSKISTLLKSSANVKFPTKADALAYDLQFWLQKENKAYASATVGISMTLSILATVFVIYLFCRMRKIVFILSILQQNAHVANADISLPGQNTFSTPEPAMKQTEWTSKQIMLLNRILIVLTIVIIADRILHYTFKFIDYFTLKKREKRWDEVESKLKLFFYSGSDKIQIQICVIPIPMTHLDWNKSAKIPRITISGSWPVKYINLDLKPLNIQHKQLKFFVKLPNKVPMTLQQIHKLQNFESNSMNGILLAENSNRSLPILGYFSNLTAEQPAEEFLHRNPFTETTVLMYKPRSHDSDLEEDLDINP